MRSPGPSSVEGIAAELCRLIVEQALADLRVKILAWQLRSTLNRSGSVHYQQPTSEAVSARSMVLPNPAEPGSTRDPALRGGSR